MKRVGFIGAYEKTDLIMYIAKLLTIMGKRVIVIDSTVNQKAKYIVPVINPTVSYVTEFEDIDVAVGFSSMNEIKRYLGDSDDSELDYDYALIDIDSTENVEKFDSKTAFRNYFVTSFDTYSIKKGLEILENIKEPLRLTKILFAKDILKEEDEYLNYLSLGYKVIWNDYKIYFGLETGDQSAIIENQRVSKIKYSNLTNQYKESLTYIAEELLENINVGSLKRALKTVEKGE